MRSTSNKGPMIALVGFVAAATVYPILAILIGFVAVAISALGFPRISIAGLGGVAARSVRRLSNPALLSIGTVALAFLLVATPSVQAATWGGGTEKLTNSNINQLAGIEIDVQATTYNGQPALKVWLANNPLSNTPLGIDMFFYGSTTFYAAWADPGCTQDGLWNNPSNNQQADGFGSFGTGAACPSGNGGITNPIYFVFTGSVPSISSNDHSAFFAVHIRFSNSCSGFVSDGTTISVKDDTNCVPTVQIPAVTDVLIPMTGLVAMVWFVGRRTKGKR